MSFCDKLNLGENMKKNVLVSVSSLPAEKKIMTYVREIQSYADFLHCDIMDATITPTSSVINASVVAEINAKSTLPLDVHLMVRSPEKYIDRYKKAGANIISIHIENFETDEQIIKLLKQIKDEKTLAGIALDEPTDIKRVKTLLPYCDIVLIMSVNIGKYGQKFSETALDKIKYLINEKRENDYKFLIEVDGGINKQTCEKLIKSGADILVSGSYVFNETNYQQAINNLKGIKTTKKEK